MNSQLNSVISPLRAWFSISILIVLVALAQIDRNSVTLMVDLIRASFGVNDFQIGLLQGPAFAAFFLVGSLLMGWLVDKYSKRWLIYIGVTIWSLATIAGGFANGFTVLLVARCFVGLGESALQPAAWSMVARLFPPARLATAISILTAGAQVGVAASFLLGGFLIAEATHFSSMPLPMVGRLEPWQFVFLASGIPGVFLAFLIFVVPPEKSPDTVDEKPSAIRLVPFMRQNRLFLTYHFVGFGLLSVMVHGAAAWAPTYLMRSHGMDIKTVGLLFAVAGALLGVGGVIVAGSAVDRSFQRGRLDAHLSQFALRCIAIAIIGGIGFMADSSLIVPLMAFGSIQFLQPFSGVAGAALQITTPVQYRGRISAIFIMFYNAAGMMLGPSFVALLSSYLGSEKLGIAIAINYCFLGSMAALFLWLGRKQATLAILSIAREPHELT